MKRDFGIAGSTRAPEAGGLAAMPIFKLIAFDWDGTAVENRAADASQVARKIERLLELGVVIVVITGTNIRNIDRQFARLISTPHKGRLFICTDRGSEVYGFGRSGEPRLLDSRRATPAEERLLDHVAEEAARRLRERGIEVEIVSDRLNRRKIDLIPVAEWADPPKSAIADLLGAVESRLAASGMAGGIKEAYAAVVRAARGLGMKGARITSDVKHIEVGLTDKGDSVKWIARRLAPSLGIKPEEILIVGDEFGPIAGFDGSDYKMFSAELERATYISVGVEPNGVPDGVIHLGGGPPAFLALLDQQIARHERSLTK